MLNNVHKKLPLMFSLSQSSCVSPVELIDGRGGSARSRIILQPKRAWPSLYKSYHLILSDHYSHFWIMVIAAICFVIWSMEVVKLNLSWAMTRWFTLVIKMTTAGAGIFKKSMGARHRGGIGFSYRPARLHRLAEFIPWNQFRGPIDI